MRLWTSTARSPKSLVSELVAVIDATDLYPQDQRDFLVQAAFDGLYRLDWSETILQETACAIHRRLREREGLSRRTATERMLGLLSSALTAVGAGQALDEAAIRARIAAMSDDRANWGTTDPDDRHVIAAALVAGADVLVSSDKRFDAEYCQRQLGFRVLTADAFLLEIFGDASDEHITAPLDALAARWKKPAQFTRPQVVGRLQTPLPEAIEYLIEKRRFAIADPPGDVG